MTALLVPVDSIVVKQNRQRRDFDIGALNELAEGIQRNGLLHAPVVRFENGETVLVAGERRLRAIKDTHDLGGSFTYAGKAVPPGLCPIVPLGELSELEAEEAELEENIRRVDLSWQEKAEASARLMSLRQRQAAAEGRPAPTVSDIAREVRNLPPSATSPEQVTVVGSAQTATRNEILVARHLADPEVAGAKSLGDAVKILKRREEIARNQQLAASIGASFTSKSHRLLNEDCLAWLPAQPEGQFDIILTDPPYGMGADNFGDSGQGPSAGAHFYQDDYDSWYELMGGRRYESDGTYQQIHEGLPAMLYRAAKPEAHAYLFCDIDRFSELRSMMTGAGWKVHRTPLVWSNPAGFRAPWPDQGPQRKYELILYAVKGNRKTTKLAGDVLEFTKDKSLGHPAQKPVELLVELLRRSATPGNTVLDVCAGSGSTIEACHELKLACTALEKVPAAYAVAVKRLQSLAAHDPALF